MAFTKVVSIHLYVSRAHLTHQDLLPHFYAFEFDESPAGESFSLPAPSIKKKDSTVTSVSRPVFISTPSSAANAIRIWMGVSSQHSWEGESAVM